MQVDGQRSTVKIRAAPACAKNLVHLHVPLALLLETGEVLFEVDALGLADILEHVLDARHHALKTAEVHVRALVECVEHLVSVLLNLVLDVHLATLLVGRALTREGVVEAHLVGVLAEVHLELLVVEEGVLVGDTEEEPGETLEVLASGGGLAEEAAEEGAEGGDTGASGNHDVGHVGVILGHEHNLARRASQLDLVTGLGIAQVVGADTLLGGVVGLELGAPVSGAAHAQSGGLAILEVTCNRQQAETGPGKSE